MNNALSDNIEKMKANSHARLVEALKYDPKRVLREERIGGWIVTIEMAGGGVSKFCKIYSANTLEEHFRYSQPIPCVCEDASEEVKVFYQRWEDNLFHKVCYMAQTW